jgi:hypothetical protein
VDPLVGRAIRGAPPGRPLPDGVRAPLEGLLGADLGAVRMHADTRADQLARVLGARAFTAGREIFFRRGEYRPGSLAGQRLLAHELTHTAQQAAAPAATVGVVHRVRIDDHDTEKPEQLQELIKLAQSMNSLEQVNDMLAKAAAAGAGREPAEPGLTELLIVLRRKRQVLEYKQNRPARAKPVAPATPTQEEASTREETPTREPGEPAAGSALPEAPSRSQDMPTSNPEPSSASSLASFAAELKPRKAHEQPYSVAEHLRQRLGDVQRGKRPAVKARRRGGGGTVTTEEVSEADYPRLLDAAKRADWGPLTPADRQKLAAAMQAWTAKTKYPQQKFQGSALYKQAQIIRTTPDNPPSDVEVSQYESAFAKAWETITTQVEAEVLEAVGVPEVHILGSGDEELGNRPAFYDEKTQTIKINYKNVSPERLQHEFGHHIEEQGPVEIWYGLATLLQVISGGKPLEPPRQGATREPTFNPDLIGSSQLPNMGYALSYYPDAGTELLSLAMEDFAQNQGVLADLKTYVENWFNDKSYYLPRYVALLLHAFRPREMRELGLTYPALL